VENGSADTRVFDTRAQRQRALRDGGTTSHRAVDPRVASLRNGDVMAQAKATGVPQGDYPCSLCYSITYHRKTTRPELKHERRHDLFLLPTMSKALSYFFSVVRDELPKNFPL